jgi:hypothetical protein
MNPFSAKPCQFCDGTGRCANCRGSASYYEDGQCVDCPLCLLDEGRCAECNGSGVGKNPVRELWDAYWSLDNYGQRFTLALAVGLIAMSVFNWRFMIPFLGFIAIVVLYLRWTRNQNNL